MTHQDALQALNIDEVIEELEWAGSLNPRAQRNLDQSSEALDATIRSEKGEADAGGYAFLWQDVIALKEVVRIALHAGIDQSQLRTLLTTILKAWSKLRTVRLPLSRDQFRVLACIKSGFSLEADIAVNAKLSDARTSEVLHELSEMKYMDKLRLAEKTSGGWKTPM